MADTAAKTPDLKVVSPKKSQIDLNIEAYARVYKKCREEAKKIVGEESNEETDDWAQVEIEEIDAIAELFFDRFWTDQMEIERNKAEQDKFSPMMDQVQKMLENKQRGGGFGDYIGGGLGPPMIGGFRG